MRVATDVGGTFTDLVYVDEETRRAGCAKVPSTPPDFHEGVLAALAASGAPAAEVADFVHGTTVVVNALLERTGARTALVTTRGFRDVLEIGRGNRPDLYNLHYRKPEPYVERALRLEVSERVDHRGRVLVPLRDDEVAAVAERLRALGAEAVAVCFLHSYANPEHERRAADLLRRLLPGVAVTASSEIARVWREYERSSTAVLNAYVQPVTAAYLGALDASLRAQGVASPLYLMKSNGGLGGLEMALRQPIHLVESGPVGGVVGAAVVGRAIGAARVLALDVGGTTAKASLVEGGEVRFTTDYHLARDARHAGYPIAVPVVDVVEVGAGGGSIAWLDDRGALRVGPRSAGARPGPAAYGLGGRAPTLTDANLLLGRIDDGTFLGGRLPLRRDLAVAAFEPLARHFQVSVEDAALGVARIAEANMAQALRLVSVERGYDPREFTLVAYGGGGPIYACQLARELRIPRVVIPPDPGTFSAWGMLAAEIRDDVLRTHVMDVADETADLARSLFQELEREAAALLRSSGRDPARATFARYAGLRYRGQEHTVRIPIRQVATELVLAAFHKAHERAYTFRLDSPVEWVEFVVRAAVPPAEPIAPGYRDGGPERGPAAAGGRPARRRVRFPEGDAEVPVYARAELAPGDRVAGPAIFEEHTATTVVPPGVEACVDRFGHIVIELEDADGRPAA